MDVENNEVFTAVEDEVQKMGFLQRVASLFIAPVKLMQNIKEYPVIASMLIFVMALSLLTLPFMSRITELSQNMISEIMLARYGQDFLSLLETQSANISTTSLISAIVGVIIAYPIACFLKALVLLIITKIAKGGAKYKQYASMYAHVLIISALSGLIITPIMIAMGAILDVSSLAALFMPNGNISMMSYNLLSSITLFTIIEAVLVMIGVREINGFSNTKAIVTVLIMFALSTVFTAAMAGVSIFALDISYKALGLI